MTLDPSTRRAFAFLGMLACLSVIWPAFFLPASAARDAALGANDLLNATKARLAALERQASSLGESETMPDLALFASSSPDDSLQAMQLALRDTFTHAGGLVLVSEASQSPLAGALSKLTVSVRAQLSESSLLTLIREVETLEPQIAVEGVDVSASAGAATGSVNVGLEFAAVHRDAS